MNALVSDTKVAGGGDDFLRARHLVCRGGQRDIGRALARLAVGELGTNKKIPWSDPETTAEQLRWLREHWPAHYERSCGVAEALDLTPDDHAIDPTCLYYYWAVPGCSNVFWPPASTLNGRAVLTRNYDFTTGTVFELMGRPSPPEAENATAAPFIVEMHPDKGYATLSLSSYELLGATDGINSEGLVVALMATNDLLQSPADNTATYKSGVGINEIQLVRFLLDNAASAAEARELLTRTPQYTMWVPCHYMIADSSGDAFVYSRDVSPSAPVIRPGDSKRPLCATNHIPGHVVADVPEIENSMQRLAHLEATVESLMTDRGVAASDMLALAHSVAATAPAGEGQYASTSPSRTLWHAVYDLEARSLDIDFFLGDEPSGGTRRSDRTNIRL